jgi:hypothetical protein
MQAPALARGRLASEAGLENEASLRTSAVIATAIWTGAKRLP